MIRLAKFSYAALGAAVLSLSACGGGGGTANTPASTVVSGTASKGLLVNAKVTAYCGLKSSNVVVGNTTTDANGAYSLTLSSACSQPVEIEVTSVSGTTMLDEVKGPIAAPTGFTMRALVSAGSGTISQPVTPFTEMAVAVAVNAVSKGEALSSSLVTNANTSIITNVLGGNAGIFTATPVPPSQYASASVTTDQQQLITLLSAISAQAATGSGAAGDNIKATLDDLATQAVATIPTVTAGGYTVDKTATTPLTTLNSGLTALATATLDDPTSAATIKSSATTVKTAVVDTSTTTIASSTGTVTTPNSTVQTAIAKAQLLFQTLRANLFSIANNANNGFLQSKAVAMTTELNNASPVGNFQLGQLVSAMERAVEFLIQVKNAGGDPATLGEILVTDSVFGNHFERAWGSPINLSSYMNCRVYITSGTGVVGASPARPAMLSPTDVTNGIYGASCSVFPYTNDAFPTVRQVIFNVRTPSSTLSSPTTFAYVNKVRTYTNGKCDFSQIACAATDSNANSIPADITFTTGTITASWNANGPTGITLPAASKLVSMDGVHATTGSLNLAITAGSTGGNVGLTGNIATDTLLSLSILPGSSISATTTNGIADTASFSFLGQLDTANFRYNGTFSASATGLHSINGPSGTAGFSGKISTLANNIATPFLEGSVSADTSAKTAAFSAKVTDGSKVNSVAGTLDRSTALQTSASITYNFPGYSMSFTGTSYDLSPANNTVTVTASDGTKIVSNSSGTIVQGAGSTTTIAEVLPGGRVNFTDGTYFLMN